MRRAITAVLLSLIVATTPATGADAEAEALNGYLQLLHDNAGTAARAQVEIEQYITAARPAAAERQQYAALHNALGRLRVSLYRFSRAVEERDIRQRRSGMSLDEYNSTLSTRARAGDRQAERQQASARSSLEAMERDVASVLQLVDATPGSVRFPAIRELVGFGLRMSDQIQIQQSGPPGAGQP